MLLLLINSKYPYVWHACPFRWEPNRQPNNLMNTWVRNIISSFLFFSVPLGCARCVYPVWLRFRCVPQDSDANETIETTARCASVWWELAPLHYCSTTFAWNGIIFSQPIYVSEPYIARFATKLNSFLFSSSRSLSVSFLFRFCCCWSRRFFFTRHMKLKKTSRWHIRPKNLYTIASYLYLYMIFFFFFCGHISSAFSSICSFVTNYNIFYRRVKYLW